MRPARGRALRHRSAADRRSPVPQRGAVRARTRGGASRSRRSAIEVRGARAGRANARWCRSSVSCGECEIVPARPDRELRSATRRSRTTACSRSRAPSTAACSRTWCACRTRARCCGRSRRAADALALGERSARQRARRLPRGRAAPARAARERRADRAPRRLEHRARTRRRRRSRSGAARVDFASADAEEHSRRGAARRARAADRLRPPPAALSDRGRSSAPSGRRSTSRCAARSPRACVRA